MGPAQYVNLEGLLGTAFKEADVELPDGRKLRIRELDGNGRDEFDAFVISHTRADLDTSKAVKLTPKDMDMRGSRALLFVLSVIEGPGGPLLMDKTQAAEAARLPAGILDAVYKAATELNGLQQKETEGN